MPRASALATPTVNTASRAATSSAAARAQTFSDERDAGRDLHAHQRRRREGHERRRDDPVVGHALREGGHVGDLGRPRPRGRARRGGTAPAGRGASFPERLRAADAAHARRRRSLAGDPGGPGSLEDAHVGKPGAPQPDRRRRRPRRSCSPRRRPPRAGRSGAGRPPRPRRGGRPGGGGRRSGCGRGRTRAGRGRPRSRPGRPCRAPWPRPRRCGPAARAEGRTWMSRPTPASRRRRLPTRRPTAPAAGAPPGGAKARWRRAPARFPRRPAGPSVQGWSSAADATPGTPRRRRRFPASGQVSGRGARPPGCGYIARRHGRTRLRDLQGLPLQRRAPDPVPPGEVRAVARPQLEDPAPRPGLEAEPPLHGGRLRRPAADRRRDRVAVRSPERERDPARSTR